MDQRLPLWRSMLFVPANVPKFVDKAHQRGADAIILDLEDSVPLAEKAPARRHLATAASRASANGADVVVRINASLRLAAADLEAAVSAGVRAICVPKVSGASQLQWIDQGIAELELERGLPRGHTRLIALIESPAALARASEIAVSTPRLLAITLGPEDFSASAGMVPDADGLLYPNQQIVFAARAAGILPLGFVGSIGQYRDLEAFRETIRRSRRLGLRGGFCIHPDQVRVMNTEFAPSPEEVAEARGLLDAYEQALRANRGSAEYRGKMIDAPVVARAMETLASHEKIRTRSS
jgi:citrate lyase subunit beta/citryl-CoA lyase